MSGMKCLHRKRRLAAVFDTSIQISTVSQRTIVDSNFLLFLHKFVERVSRMIIIYVRNVLSIISTANLLSESLKLLKLMNAVSPINLYTAI